jgi:hypothetical protein
VFWVESHVVKRELVVSEEHMSPSSGLKSNACKKLEEAGGKQSEPLVKNSV